MLAVLAVLAVLAARPMAPAAAAPLGHERADRARAEVLEQVGDVPVDGDRAGVGQLVLAEAAALDTDAPEPCPRR